MYLCLLCMASVQRAISQVSSQGFVLSAGLTVAGVLVGQTATGLMRQFVYDAQLTGLDAAYSFVGAALTLAFLPRKYANPLALGMVTSGGLVLAEETGAADALRI